MAPSPVLIIPDRSPPLEAIARAVLAGAAERGAISTPDLIVADSTTSVPPGAVGNFVFVGCRGDSDESRRFALKAVRELLKSSTSPPPVAVFEVSGQGTRRSAPVSPGSGASEGDSEGQPQIRPVRFVLDSNRNGEFVDVGELDRARRWGAETFAEWLSAACATPAEPPKDSSGTSVRSVPWCGAME